MATNTFNPITAMAVLAPLLITLGFGNVAMANRAGAEQRLASAESRLSAAQSDLMVAAAGQEGSDVERRDREQRMQEAQTRLEEAAREIAEISSRIELESLRDVAAELGAERRAILGINIASAENADRAPQRGVTIQGVSPGGPADEAGLQAGDIILRIDDQDLGRGHDAAAALLTAMGAIEPGEEVELVYSRGGDQRHATVTTGEMSRAAFRFDFGKGDVPGPNFEFSFDGDPAQLMAPADLADIQRHFARFAATWWQPMELVGVSSQLGAYFDVDRGLLVVRAPAESALGLLDGDVIVAINGVRVDTPGDAMRILRRASSGDVVAVELVRQRETLTLDMKVPENRNASGRDWHNGDPERHKIFIYKESPQD